MGYGDRSCAAVRDRLGLFLGLPDIGGSVGARATTQTAMADNKLARWASLRYLIHASSPVFASSLTDFHYGP